MNRYQRELQGNRGVGTVESAVDNVRGEYEQAVWGRRTTGDENVNLTPNNNRPVNDFYGNNHANQLEQNNTDIDDGMDR